MVLVWKGLFCFYCLFSSLFSGRHPLSAETMVAAARWWKGCPVALKEETMPKHLFKTSSIVSLRKDHLTWSWVPITTMNLRWLFAWFCCPGADHWKGTVRESTPVLRYRVSHLRNCPRIISAQWRSQASWDDLTCNGGTLLGNCWSTSAQGTWRLYPHPSMCRSKMNHSWTYNLSFGAPAEPRAVVSRNGHTVVAIFLGFILFFGFLNNLIVLILFCKFKTLRNPVNMLLLNISISDMLVCVSGTTLSFASNIHGKWIGGEHGCRWYGFVNSCFGKSLVIILLS